MFHLMLLNKCLLHYFSETCVAMMLSICVNDNVTFYILVFASVFKHAPTHFPHFFKCVMESCLSGEQLCLSLKEQTVLLLFLDHCFNSLVNIVLDLIREQVQKLVSLPMWMYLLQMRLQQELKKVPKLQKFWNLIKKNYEKMEPQDMEQVKKECTFLASFIKKFLVVLMSIPAAGSVSMEKVHCCERFIEFMIDLEVSCHSRFLRFLIFSYYDKVSTKCKFTLSLLDMLKFYTGFEISDQTGSALTQKEMTTLHYNRITAAFAHFPELSDFALYIILVHLSACDPNTLHRVSAYLCLLPVLPDAEDTSYHKEFLLELKVFTTHAQRLSQDCQLNQMPLYPAEKIIWDQYIVATEYYSGEGCLALPKLNLQFLTLHNYLLRNFSLFHHGLNNSWTSLAKNGVGGWTKMAQSIASFSIMEVTKPNIKENWPVRVRADVTLNLKVRDNIKSKWEGLRKHDVCFLITVRPNLLYSTRFDRRQLFVDQTGVVYVRGCEVQGMLDDKGRVIEEESGHFWSGDVSVN
uniref:Uncharacterized protein n=1 Tax=Cyprinus carpio carpio TaxID=630221 RepID=A0A8C1CTE1_CYPCA